jgi:hypothetical protein
MERKNSPPQTVGDVASWIDSLLVAGLLRFGAQSFTRVAETRQKRKQLAYTFQVGRAGRGAGQPRLGAG